jgi:hypothetical protein
VLSLVVIFAPTRVAIAQQASSILVIDEIRGGAVYHDVPGLFGGDIAGHAAIDANAEVLLVPLTRIFGGKLRPAIGGTISFNNDFNRAYADLRWEFEAVSGVFYAAGLGAAYYSGQVEPDDPSRKALGSPILFHPSAELGYRVDALNSVSLFVDHISNGFTRRYNDGVNSLGVRIGHRFAESTVDEDHAPAQRFQGAYVGAFVGGRTMETDWGDVSPGGRGTWGAFGGGYAGYNWQSGRGVFGFEADFAPGTLGVSAPCLSSREECSVAVDQVGSFRARLGWVMGNAMIYGTGGLAIARWEADASSSSNGITLTSARATTLGVALGTGIDARLSDHLTGRAEIMHYGMFGTAVSQSAGDLELKQIQETTARIGLAWQFH